VGDAAFCIKCGNQLRPSSPPAGASYCGKCGQILPGVSLGAGAVAPEEYGLPVSYASPLCYLFGFVSGLVMYFVDKRPIVRFHAVQSTIVFSVLDTGIFILGRFARDALSEGSPLLLTYTIAFFAVGLAALAIWILLIVRAFDRKPLSLPIAGKLAELISGSGKK